MALQPENVLAKLHKLDATQDSICNVSEYCRFFAKEAHKLVSLWETEFDRSRESAKRLALLYLANDILQNSRKRGTQFVQPFYRVLPRTVRLTLKNGDAKVQAAVKRVVKIWDERRVFGGLSMKLFSVEDHSDDLVPRSPAPENGGALHVDTSQLQQLQDMHAGVEQQAAAAAGMQQRCRNFGPQDGLLSEVARGALEQHVQAARVLVEQRAVLITLLRDLLQQQESAQEDTQAALQTSRGRLQGVTTPVPLSPPGPQPDEEEEEAYSPTADPPQPLGSPAAPIEAYTPSAPGLPSAGSLADARLSQQRSGSLLAQPPPYVPEPVRPPAASPQPQPPSWALHVPSPVQGARPVQPPQPSPGPQPPPEQDEADMDLDRPGSAPPPLPSRRDPRSSFQQPPPAQPQQPPQYQPPPQYHPPPQQQQQQQHALPHSQAPPQQHAAFAQPQQQAYSQPQRPTYSQPQPAYSQAQQPFSLPQQQQTYQQPQQPPVPSEPLFAGDFGASELQAPAPAMAFAGMQGMSDSEAAEFARQLAASGLNSDTLAQALLQAQASDDFSAMH